MSVHNDFDFLRRVVANALQLATRLKGRISAQEYE